MPALRTGVAAPSTLPAREAAAAPSVIAVGAIPGHKTAAEGRYACAPCDRGFDGQADLAEHIAAHISCHAPGCAFSAGRRVVQAHYIRVHASAMTGPPRLPPSLVELIPPKYRGAAAIGNTTAEVERWRADRRLHFPTTAVVEAKRRTAEARVFRGDPAAEGGRSGGRRDPPAAASVAKGKGEGEGGGSIAAGGRELEGDGGDDDGPPEEAGTSLADAYALASAAAAAGDAPIAGGLAGAATGGKRPRPPPVVCRSFVSGRCQHGANCPFSHDPEDAAAASAAAAAAPRIARVPAQPLLSVNARASRPGSGVPACRWFLLGTCR